MQSIDDADSFLLDCLESELGKYCGLVQEVSVDFELVSVVGLLVLFFDRFVKGNLGLFLIP